MSPKSTVRLSEIRHSLSLAFASLVTGSRTIPLGDNGNLLRELALRGAAPSLPSQGTRSAAQPRVSAV
jgi:hypothetical protein